MKQTAINYGQVLLELGIPGQDICQAKKIWEMSLPLREALSSPVVQRKQKEKVIEQVFPKSMHAFMKVVCRYQEEELLGEIFRAYEQLADRKAGILQGTLYYVQKPEEGQLEQIRQKLARRNGAQSVQLTLVHKPELIGGFVIRLGDLELDESLLGSMNRLKEKMIRR